MRSVPGRTYRLAEPDYRFGSGPMLITITEVVAETVFDDELWFEVEALVKALHAVGPARPRRLYVRGAALPGPEAA